MTDREEFEARNQDELVSLLGNLVLEETLDEDTLGIMLLLYYESLPWCPEDDYDEELGGSEWAVGQADKMLKKIIETLRPTPKAPRELTTDELIAELCERGEPHLHWNGARGWWLAWYWQKTGTVARVNDEDECTDLHTALSLLLERVREASG